MVARLDGLATQMFALPDQVIPTLSMIDYWQENAEQHH
jgi:hypothetical protein